MKALFLKCGYNFIGEISFLGKETPFYCYDKMLVMKRAKTAGYCGNVLAH
jgi:hypothetical protein